MTDFLSASQHETYFKIYSSSAGSGKTYTLAKEYIKLALRSKSPWYFNHILAVTFTNKAAGEMKERILKYLRIFSSNDPQEQATEQGLFNQILEELQQEGIEIDEVTLRARASATFKHIIHEYANFSVSTIDSFVQRVVSAFTEELGFPFNFEVNLDSEVLLDAAVEQLLQKTNTETYEQITEAIKSFALDKATDGRSWNGINDEIANFGRDLLNDQFQEHIEKLGALEPLDFLKIEQQLKDFNQGVEKHIKEIVAIALETANENDLTVDDFAFKKTGPFSYFIQLANGNDVFKEPGARFLNALADNTWHAKSATKPIAATIMGIADTLTDTGNFLLEAQKRLKPRFLLYREILKQIKKLALLSQLKKEIAAIQDESGQIHISEFNRKILEIVVNEPIPFIYERLGERYNHILIDEFQDTSTLQWHNFLPLIENALASGHFNLAVGDAKQSIYRFRGGEMGLIVNLHKKQIDDLTKPIADDTFLVERYESIRPYIKPENLNTNYRSSAEVINFNNALFEAIKVDPEYLAIAPSLPRVYDDYFAQKVPAKPLEGGHVQVDFIIGKETDRLMIEKVEQILEEVLAIGYKLKDVAVLCRRNKDSKVIANALKERNIDVISSDSLSLAASDAVNLIMAIMKVVQNPDNALAKYEAVYLYYRVVLHKVPNTQENKVIKETIESRDILKFFELIDKNLVPTALQQMSLYEIAEKLLQTFELFKHDKELDFIFRFLDVVIEFQHMKSTHLTDFINYWENKKESLSIMSPAGQNAVTVTSVHKSKGLEFPVVIIPYCHWSIDTGLNSSRWFGLEDEGLFEELIVEQAEENITKALTTAPLKMVKELENTHLVDEYRAEKEETFLESLNMLYVALTRPKDRLYMVVKRDSRNLNKTVGGLLLRFVDGEGLPPEEPFTKVLYEGLPKVLKPEKEKMSPTMIIQEIVTSERSQTIQLKQSAERLFDLETFEKSKDYGNKVHAAFAKIKTKKDIDSALADLQREGLIVENEQEELKVTIQKIIDLPEISPFFEVPERFIRNEREILRPNQSPLRPDRVIKMGSKIVILDYKTGSKSNSHKYQVKDYQKIYQAMGYTEVEGYLVYLETMDIVKV
ncbi:UvrD-helicase domain-containing protein [Flectobacillus roseus]|uniref:DNA 3'-5' helicase n=1 Tax=Flectobacillus roseus TaxID=502259 RepID=A0ABT6Y3A4_9BACT|nr:UvrD-helicase domain-containing protein [Flectobacillus roseus]MDI9857578.1 UvrD-helicase domain-containing protein [Flectobacillus roseus]